jgi:hypothetical protein
MHVTAADFTVADLCGLEYGKNSTSGAMRPTLLKMIGLRREEQLEQRFRAKDRYFQGYKRNTSRNSQRGDDCYEKCGWNAVRELMLDCLLGTEPSRLSLDLA